MFFFTSFIFIIQLQPSNFNFLSLLSKSILDVVIEYCNCDYTDGYITQEHFLCAEETSRNVLYRARVFSTNIVESEIIVGYIQSWVMSNPDAIRSNNTNTYLNIDPNCGVNISSLNNSMLCFISDDPVIPTSSVTQHSLDSTNVSVGTIIGVSFCGVLLFAILVITVSIIVFIILWRKKKKDHSQLSILHNANPAYISSKGKNGLQSNSEEMPSIKAKTNPSYISIKQKML